MIICEKGQEDKTRDWDKKTDNGIPRKETKKKNKTGNEKQRGGK